MRWRPAAVLLPAQALGLAATACAARDPAPVDPDRLHALTSTLRCVVCQNESLADSTAPLAQDLKREIRERMAAGESDAQIQDFLVQRYGDFVTYRPPLSPRTWLLWVLPALLLAGGAGLLWRHTRTGPQGGPGNTDAAPADTP